MNASSSAQWRHYPLAPYRHQQARVFLPRTAASTETDEGHQWTHDEDEGTQTPKHRLLAGVKDIVVVAIGDLWRQDDAQYKYGDTAQLQYGHTLMNLR